MTQIAACFLALSVAATAAEYVCIGVNNSEGYPSLKWAEQDAVLMANLLKDQGHTVTLLIGADATIEAVKSSVAEKQARVYFAGHGEADSLVLADGRAKVSDFASDASLLLLDCCYIGSSVRDAGTTRTLAAAQHEAFEGKEHGLFSKYLLSWVQKGKELSDDALAQYVQKGIKRETGGWQRPVLGYI